MFTLRKNMNRLFKAAFIAAALLSLTLSTLHVSAADERSIEITTPFPSVSVDAGHSLSHLVTVRNKGDVAELVEISIFNPPQWSIYLEAGGFEVKSIYLPPGGNVSFIMIIYPPPTEEAGTYLFELSATTTDGTMSSTLPLAVEITHTFESEIEVFCPTFELKGPSTQQFNFNVQVVNHGEAKTITYDVVYPEGWEADVRGTYGDETIVTESYTEGESKTIKVVVNPPELADRDTYTILMRASFGNYTAERYMWAVITGIYKVDITTATVIEDDVLTGLVSTAATSGEETIVGLLVTNEGTGTLGDITISVPREPYGWVVLFTPNMIPVLNPGEIQYIEMSIKPATDTIPGDYELEVGAYTGTPHYRTDIFSLRVSASAPTAWGYIGGIVIAATLAGFIVVFWRFGRR